jgi:hypothetical protein
VQHRWGEVPGGVRARFVTASLVAVLVCDSCAREFRGRSRLVQAARAAAYDNGWVHRLVPVKSGPAPSLDFCGACQASNYKVEHHIALVTKSLVKKGRA